MFKSSAIGSALRIFILVFIISMLAGLVVAQVLPRLVISNTDSFVSDQNGNNLADPNDVLQYSVTIANCDSEAAQNLVYNSNIDPNTTLLDASVQVSGAAPADSSLCGSSQNNPTSNAGGGNTANPNRNMRAVDDSVLVTNGSTQTLNLLGNDSGSNPLQALFFGDALPATIAADGVATFTSPSGVIYTLSASGVLTIDASAVPTGTVLTETLFYEAQAGNGSTDTAQVTINFGDFPVAVDDTLATLAVAAYRTTINTPLTLPAGSLFTNDTLGTPAATLIRYGGGSVSGTINRNPGTTTNFAGASITVNADGSFAFTPATGFTGTVSFYYRLQNTVGTDDALVEIYVEEAPTAFNDANFTVALNAITSFPASTLFSNNGSGADDLGAPPATISLFGLASPTDTSGTTLAGVFAGGDLTVFADGSFTITNPTSTGVFTFQYRLDNGVGTSDATVTVTIVATPVPANDTYTVLNNAPAPQINAADLTADTGSGTDNAGSPAFTSLQFGGGDLGGSNTVTSGNSVTVPFAAAGGNLTISMAGGAGTAAISLSGTTSGTNLIAGTYNFDYQLTNSNGTSVPATVTIIVQGAPDAVADTYTVACGVLDTTYNSSAAGLLANDFVGLPATTIFDYGAPSVRGVSPNFPHPLSNGSIVTVQADGSMVVDGVGGGVTEGVVSFEYSLDNGIASDTALVNLTINAQSAPVAGDDSANTPVNTAYNSAPTSVLDNDTRNCGTITAFDATSANGGTVTMNAVGEFTYTPAAAFTGLDTFTYTLSNSQGSVSATVTMTVGNLPIAVDDTAGTGIVYQTAMNTTLDTAASGNPTILLNDTLQSGQISSVAASSCGTYPSFTYPCNGTTANGGTVAVNADGSFVFSPATNDTGVDSFTYTLQNGLGTSAAATVEIAIDAAPAVSATTPTNGAANVAVNADLSITFDETVTLTGNWLDVLCTTSGALDETDFSITDADPVYTLTPNNPFAVGESCSVTVNAAQVADDDAIDPPNNMAADYVFSFTTVDNAPSVLSSVPANGALNVTLGADISVSFDEAVTLGASWFDVVCTTSGTRNPADFAVTDADPVYTLNPNTDFVVGEDCTLTVYAAEVTDDDLVDPPNTMAANYTATFTVIDDNAPAVLNTLPANGATNVALNADLNITFDEAVTLGASWFNLVCSSTGTRTIGDFAVTDADPVYTLNPTADFVAGETCTGTVVAAQVSDDDTIDPPNTMAADTVFSFTVINDAAPSVSATTPTNGATNVAINADLSITFDEAVTLTGNWLDVLCTTSGALDETDFSITDADPVYTLTPNNPFAVGESCSVTVNAAQVADDDLIDPPNNMAADYVFSFTTVDNAPSVLSSVPANGALNVALGADITVSFDEAVTLGASWFDVVCTTSGTRNPADFAITDADPNYTLNPNADFIVGEDCTLTVYAAEVTDDDTVDPPDNMAANYTATFTVIDDNAPAVASTTPADTATNVALNADLNITFDEAVTLGASWFNLVCSSTGTRNIADFTVTDADPAYTLNPNADFAAGETCTGTVVASEVSDDDTIDPPNNMAADTVFSFTVINDAAPAVSATTPTNGAANVAVNADLSITFDESVTLTGNWLDVLCTTSGALDETDFSITDADPVYTLTPNTAFAVGESCQVTVNAAQVADDDVIDPPNNMLADYVFSFTTSDNAPAVLSSVPANGALNVALGADISVSFDEAVTLGANWFDVVCTTSGTRIPTDFAVTDADPVYTLNPNTDFVVGEDCTLTVYAAEVTDDDTVDPPDNMAANYTATFTVIDDNAPAVLSTLPANGATNVALNADLNITFDEAVTLGASWFNLVCSSTGTRNLADFAVTDADPVYTLNPTADFVAGETCTGTVVASEVSDDDLIDPPNTMAADTVFSFTVINDAAPSVSATTPTNGAANVAINADLNITFDETVTLTGNWLDVLCTTSGALDETDFSITDADPVYTLTPNTAFAVGESCQVTVNAAQVADDDVIDPPNNMAADYVFSFTTVDNAPSVLSSVPANGALNVTLGADISVSFDEAVTLGASWFDVVCTTSGTRNPADFAVTDADPVYTLNPNTDFVVGEDCTLTVYAAEVTDDDTVDPPDNMAANYTATFTVIDDNAPAVLSTLPANGATNVALNADLNITFDEAVTLGVSWFNLVCSSTGTRNLADFAVTDGDPVYTLNPTADFAAGETCTGTVVASEVSDDDTIDPPNTMAADTVFSFTVINDAAPSVSATTPTNGAANVAVNADLSITFDETVTLTGNWLDVLCTTSGALDETDFSITDADPVYTLTPNTAFAIGESCSVTVNAAQVADDDAIDPPNNMAADYVFSFTTVDNAPSVLSSVPANGALNVALGADITVSFDEAVTLGASWFDVVCTTSGPHNPTNVAVTDADPNYTLNPNSDFVVGEDCTLTVYAAEVTDDDLVDPPNTMAANYVATFTVIDDNAPAVLSTLPANGAANVALNADLSITFDEAVTLGASWFNLVCSSTGTRTIGDFAVTDADPVYTLNPNADFAAGETCTGTVVASEVADDDAIDPPNNLAADYVFSFTVINDNAPQVSSTTPADTATNVALAANVDVTFDEAVTVSGDWIEVNCPSGLRTISGGGLVSSGSGTNYSVNPVANFAAGEICQVTVNAAQVADDDAIDPPNNMAADYVFSFTTVDNAPAVSATTPTNGAVNVALTADLSITFNEAVTVAGNWFSLVCSSTGTRNITDFAVTDTDPVFTLNPNADFVDGESCTGTVTALQVTDDDTVDPPNTMAADYVFSFTVIDNSLPICYDDAFLATGNVSIDSLNGPVTVFDDNGFGADDAVGLGVTTLVSEVQGSAANVGAATSSTNGGTITLNADGTFTYTPATGFTGDDTFTYRIGNGVVNSSLCTVTVSISDQIWFIDDAAPAGGDGSQAEPFNTIAAFNAANGVGSGPNTGDFIFIEDNGSSYNGSFSLLASQTLIGEGATGSLFGGGSLTGITLAPLSVMPYSTTGAVADRAQITSAANAINLATDNTLRGLEVGDTTGTGIVGTNFGLLTVRDSSVLGLGAVLNLNTGTLDAIFDDLQGLSSGVGILLDTISSGTLTVNNTTTLTLTAASTSNGLDVRNNDDFDFNFATTTVVHNGTGSGVELFNNLNQNSDALFESIDSTTANGKALNVFYHNGTFTVTNDTGDLNATNGACAHIDSGVNSPFTVTVNAQFNTCTAMNSVQFGLLLQNADGPLFRIQNNTTITSASPDDPLDLTDVNAVLVDISEGATVDINNRGKSGIFVRDFDGGQARFGDVDIDNPLNTGDWGIRVDYGTGQVFFQSTDITNTVTVNQEELNSLYPAYNIPVLTGNHFQDGDGDAIFIYAQIGAVHITGGGLQGDGGTITGFDDNAIDMRDSATLNLTDLTIGAGKAGHGTPIRIYDGTWYSTFTRVTINTIVESGQSAIRVIKPRGRTWGVIIVDPILNGADTGNIGVEVDTMDIAGFGGGTLYIEVSSTGTAASENCLISGFNGRGIDLNAGQTSDPVATDNGVVILNVTDCTIRDSDFAGGISVLTQEIAVVSTNIEDNRFLNSFPVSTTSGVVEVGAYDSAQLYADIQNNVIQTALADGVLVRGGYSGIDYGLMRVNVSGNTIDDLTDLFATEAIGIHAIIEGDSSLTNRVDLYISNNQIGTSTGVDGDGIRIEALVESEEVRARILNNTIGSSTVNVGQQGIEFDVDATTTVHGTVTNNNIFATAAEAVEVDIAAGATSCMNVQGNSFNGDSFDIDGTGTLSYNPAGDTVDVTGFSGTTNVYSACALPDTPPY